MFLTHQLAVYTASWFWHAIWHSSWHIYFGILSDILFDILSGTYSDIISGIYFDILSGILDLASILTVYLASFQAFVWHSFWHSFWHSIWHSEVRPCPLRSGARSWGLSPRLPEEEKKEEAAEATLIKSREPHLAGGEKTRTWTWFNCPTIIVLDCSLQPIG